jgi:hypothetical protein
MSCVPGHKKGGAIKKEPQPPLKSVRDSLELSVHNLDDAKESLRKVLFLSEGDYYLILLWAAQCYLYDFFPACWDLAFAGPFSSAKSFATECSLYLVPKSEMLSDPSEAYISRFLDRGGIPGIDEADTVIKKGGVLASILRSSNRKGAKRGVVVEAKDGEGNKVHLTHELDLFRPKVFNFMNDLDNASMSRKLIIQMTREDNTGLIARGMFMNDYLFDVREYLKRTSEEKRKEWNEKKIKELILSPKFHREIEDFHTAVPRSKQIAMVALATAKIMGWEITQVLKDAVALQEQFQDDELTGEIKDFLAKKFEKAVSCQEKRIGVTEARNEFNKEKNLTPGIGHKRWGGYLRQIGFKDGETKVKDSADRGRWKLVINECTNKLVQSGTTGTSGTKRSGANIPDVPDKPDSVRGEQPQSDKINYIISMVKEGDKYRENLVSDIQKRFESSRADAEYHIEYAIDKDLIIEKSSGEFILGRAV